MELQQSPEYTRYVRSLGWTVVTVDGANVFLRSIPVVGVIAKMQRPDRLPYLPKLIPALKKYAVRTIAVEPTEHEDPIAFEKYIRTLGRWFRIYPSHFLPTKTVTVDVTGTEDEIFSHLSQAKRRAVRRAAKNGVRVISGSINDLIGVKARSAGMFGGITTYGADRLARALGDTHVDILLAVAEGKHQKQDILGGVLLLYWNKTALYWIAGATRTGKKLFAPTALVWECLRRAHARKMTSLDFLGVWDERLSRENRSWLGFTRFKDGFGGKTVYYPIA